MTTLTHESASTAVEIGPAPLPPGQFVAVARHDARIELTGEALARIRTGRAVVDQLADSDSPIYGVSTGFGALASTRISVEERARLQQSLIRSHAAGAGPAVEAEVVRAMMLSRVHTFATGHTGVSESTARIYAGMLNAGITPVVREYGSLGCSGDLAPLATCALAATGEGEVQLDGKIRPAREALLDAGLQPVVLQAKEGLALINGTDGMLGMLVLAIADLERLAVTADITTAMSVEALLGTDRVFAADLHLLRPHRGQAVSAQNLRRLLESSDIMASHRGASCTVVQDAYSLRCAPHVTGAFRDTVSYAASVAATELASAIDNPSVLPDGRIESHGNFHGAPVAYVIDFLAIAAADLASISERRTDRLLDPARSNGLPAFLGATPGVDSGLMIAQYTQAALVSELKRLAVPASVDSIPSSAMQEDHVSMGWSAARKLRRAIAALRTVLAIEALAATRALELRSPLQPSPATRAAMATVRVRAGGAGADRWLTPEIEAICDLLDSPRFIAAVAAVVDLGLSLTPPKEPAMPADNTLHPGSETFIPYLDAREAHPGHYRDLLPRAELDVEAAIEVVRPVCEDVRRRGAEAVREITLRFDGVDRASTKVPASELDRALASLDGSVRSALEEAIRRSRQVHESQLPAPVDVKVSDGGIVSERWIPVRRVGLYVPGGLVAYPSSVVMNVVPAQVAGVGSLAVASPPQRENRGLPDPVVLAACALLGIGEVHAVGGAQAIAMFAYGTRDCRPVDVVTGPGNVYVAAAKRLLRGRIGIDSEAGPTEIGILADDSADPAYVAADLISQAEHDPNASCLLVTDSQDLVRAVDRELRAMLPQVVHRERVQTALRNQSALVLVRDLEQGLEVVDEWAAEHLEVITRDARDCAARVTNAGAIFVGPYSPVSLGDYLAGSNHVLPTGGTARHTSGLGVPSFLRQVHVIDYTLEALTEVVPHIDALGHAENLPSHVAAVQIRLTR